MKTTTFYRIGFFVLLALNIALLIAVNIKKPRHQHPPKKEMKERLSHRLSFSEQQKVVFFKLVDEHHDRMKKNDKELKKLSKKYFDGLKGEPSSDQFFLLAQISSLETKKIEEVYQHFEAIKLLCNEEQLKAFPLVLEKALGPILGMRPEKRNNKQR